MELHVAQLKCCIMRDDIPVRQLDIVDGLSFVCTRNDEFLIMCRLYVHESGTYEIADIYANEKYRGQGHAKPFLKQVLYILGQNYGIQDIWLWTVRSNTIAVNLYHSLGFVETSISQQMRDTLVEEHPWMKNEEMVYMTLSLPEHVSNNC